MTGESEPAPVSSDHWIEWTVPAERADIVAWQLWEAGAVAIEERPDGDAVLLVAGFADDDGFGAAIQRVPGGVIRTDAGEWREVWKQFVEPYTVAETITVLPTWRSVPADAAAIAVHIDPGRSFGLDHATTRLCLEALCRWVRADDTVLDVGCGSGLLGIAALCLGARHCVAIDSQVDAITDTRSNAERNGVGSRLVARLEAIEHHDGSLDSYDLVVANLGGADVVVVGAGTFHRALRPGGILVVSGLLASNVAACRGALSPFAEIERNELDGWHCLVLRVPER